jgi:hypothetical protein
MLTLDQIRAAIRERLDGLRPVVDEVERLEKALAALEAAAPKRRKSG